MGERWSLLFSVSEEEEAESMNTLIHPPGVREVERLEGTREGSESDERRAAIWNSLSYCRIRPCNAVISSWGNKIQST